MNDSDRKRFQAVLDQHNEVYDGGGSGVFGESLKGVPGGIMHVLERILTFNRDTSAKSPEVEHLIREQFRSLLDLCGAAAAVDALPVHQFTLCLDHDHPESSNSRLLDRFESLAGALTAQERISQDVQGSGRALVWSNQKDVCSSYNEMLAGMCGWIVLLASTALKKPFKPGSFGTAYGESKKRIEALGEEVRVNFNPLLIVMRPDLRNAIAHSRITLDSDDNLVFWTDRSSGETRHQIDLVEFIALNHLGSHLISTFTAATAVAALYLQVRNVHDLLPVELQINAIRNGDPKRGQPPFLTDPKRGQPPFLTMKHRDFMSTRRLKKK